MKINELKVLQNEFLNRWPIEEVKKLTLRKYVDVGNKDTFCQWVETKTRMLGSIKGMTSIKFGIYKRKDPKKRPKKYKNDESYSWLTGYGDSRKIAFNKTKQDIVKIIKYSKIGKFDLIDDIILPNLFKWKVAALYSNERLIPIFKKEVLLKIANHFGLKTTRKTKISEIHNLMISHKPISLSVYEFMRQLYDEFGEDEDKEVFDGVKTRGARRIRRRETTKKNIKFQIRKSVHFSFVEQKHNKIQEALKEKLMKEYGENNVSLEKDFIDIKVVQPKFIALYEVKSSSYASECIKEGLGQILFYSFNDTDKRKKKHFVVGQYPPTESDKKFIEFLKQNLKLEFYYINQEIQ